MPQTNYNDSRVQVTPPSTYPVNLIQVKEQLKCGDDEDEVLNRYIGVATRYTENYLSRALMPQTWDVYFDNFPWCDTTPIVIPSPPLISVTYVHYWDNDDVEQTWDSAEYVVDTTKQYGGIVYPDNGETYPNVRIFPKSVVVRYIAGYSSGTSPETGDNVPEEIKQAILMLVGHYYENRESTTPAIAINEVPMGYQALLASYKVRNF